MPHVSLSQCSPASLIYESFSVCASNGRKLVAIIVPCYRIIGSGGRAKLTGYGGTSVCCWREGEGEGCKWLIVRAVISTEGLSWSVDSIGGRGRCKQGFAVCSRGR